MYRAYKDKAQFFLVYVREAHPDQLKRLGCKETPPATLEERAAVARKCAEDLKLSLPVILADMEGNLEKAYSSWPARSCIINKEGKLAYVSRASPKGINPQEIEVELKKVLEVDRAGGNQDK